MQVGVRCVRLEGSQGLEQRDRMIAAFTDDPGVTVFLMSLKAGGVALNLTAASHVFLMDPWWNPAVEQQARPGLAFCHRPKRACVSRGQLLFISNFEFHFFPRQIKVDSPFQEGKKRPKQRP